ncbi:dihydrodipicolinate synthase family protein [soil metagenome]
MTELRGCIPILCTPFHDDLSIDVQSIGTQVDWAIAEGASGVSTLALASEGYKLTEAEREVVARTVIDAVDRRVPVVVSADGTGHSIAIDRAVRAAEWGADALMVLPPSFVKPDRRSLFDYYAMIGRAVEIPVMIQDAPQLTGVSMGPGLWAELANEVPTIRYVKAEGTPQGATISETLRLGAGKLAMFCGWGGLGALDAFERGAIGSMPAVNFTRLFAEVQLAFDAGNVSIATKRFNGELPYSLWAMQSLDFSISAAKRELLHLGVISSAAVREPVQILDDISHRQLNSWIENHVRNAANELSE